MNVQFMITMPISWADIIIDTIILIVAVWLLLYAQIRRVDTTAAVQMDTLEMEDGSAVVAMVCILLA